MSVAVTSMLHNVQHIVRGALTIMLDIYMFS